MVKVSCMLSYEKFSCLFILYISELILLLRRLHEAFIAIAAQLQQVHEAVKVPMKQYFLTLFNKCV